MHTMVIFIYFFKPGHDGPPGDHFWFLEHIIHVLTFGDVQIRQNGFSILRDIHTEGGPIFSCIDICLLFFIWGFVTQQVMF